MLNHILISNINHLKL